MAYVALALSFLLSLVCLSQDSRERTGLSLAIALPTLWMMRVASRAFGYWLPASLSASGDPVGLSVLTVAGLAVLATRRDKVGPILRANPVFLCFFLYMTVSVLWTPDFGDTFKRWFRELGDVTMALIVLTETNPFAAILCVMRRAVIFLIPLSLVLSLYFPAIGIGEGGSWVGVTVDKNWLGLVCAASAAILLLNWQMRRRQATEAADIRLAGVPFEIPFLALSLYILNGGAAAGQDGARSSTAIVLLAAAIGLFHFIAFVTRRQIKIRWLVTVSVTGFLLFQVLPRALSHRTLSDHIIEDILHKDVNLTDRTDFWPLLVDKGMMHPWLGSGFDSFFSERMQDEIQAELTRTEVYFRPNQAHNGYLQVFLTLGFTGLFLLALTIYAALRGNAKLIRSDFEFGRIRLILLGSALASNYTEATFARPTEFVWFLFLLVSINPIVSSAKAVAVTVNQRIASGRLAAVPERVRVAGRVRPPVRPVQRFRV